METFLKPPIIIFRRLRLERICTRQFRSRTANQSFGLGPSKRTDEDVVDLDLPNMSKHRAQISHHWLTKDVQAAALKSSPDKIFGRVKFMADDKATQTSDVQKTKILAFAEGYWHGKQKEAKSIVISKWLREGLIWTAIAFGLYIVIAKEGPFKGVMMGSNNMEVRPEELSVTLADVKGCDEAKQELGDVVEYLRNPERFKRLGGKLPKGVLLVGPPGTGKTLLARAVAGEAGVPFFHAAGSEFDEILVGQGARRVRELFSNAKLRAPCVIFIDEMDSVGAKRSSSLLHPYANQTINQLLSEMDGFSQNEGIIVLGATNRPKELDSALLRPGRFDVKIHVRKPDSKGRKEILQHYLSKVRASPEIDIDKLCKATMGFTGADIENLINQAALRAATDNLDMVTGETLDYARDKIMMGPEFKSRVPDPEENLATAYHEAGHALVLYYTRKHPAKLNKVTITARNESAGHTSYIPDKDWIGFTKEQLSASIDVNLGGRIAEEIILGSERVSTGCSNDLDTANNLATSMVKHYGMSDKIGMRTLSEHEGESKFSEATIELVDSEISRILNVSIAI